VAAADPGTGGYDQTATFQVDQPLFRFEPNQSAANFVSNRFKSQLGKSFSGQKSTPIGM
jgi:hypothetical protein